MEEGAKFFWKDFPLHVTLAGIFAIDLNSLELFEKLSDLLQSQEPISSTAEAEANWGNNGEILVMKLQKNDAITSLHDKIIDFLLKEGATFNEPQYEGDGYIPHATAQKHKCLNTGDLVQIIAVTIVDLFPDSNGYQRKILKTIDLSK